MWKFRLWSVLLTEEPFKGNRSHTAHLCCLKPDFFAIKRAISLHYISRGPSAVHCQLIIILTVYKMRYKGIKSVVCNSNPIHFFLSNSENISSRSACCPFCVCAENKFGVHTQPWLCKWETNRVCQTEPHNSCSCIGQHRV